MHNDDYDEIVRITITNAREMIEENPSIKDDEDRFHDVLFGRVLTEIDGMAGGLSHYEAEEISSVCQDVENDIIDGDILGL
jgi:hypothetical protein